MPKVRKIELSFLSYSTFLPNSIRNFFKGYSSYRADRKSISKTKQREITPKVRKPEFSVLYKTPKVRKPELSFLYATGCLVLLYISTQYHQNIPKVFELQKGHETYFKQNEGR